MEAARTPEVPRSQLMRGRRAMVVAGGSARVRGMASVRIEQREAQKSVGAETADDGVPEEMAAVDGVVRSRALIGEHAH